MIVVDIMLVVGLLGWRCWICWSLLICCCWLLVGFDLLRWLTVGLLFGWLGLLVVVDLLDLLFIVVVGYDCVVVVVVVIEFHCCC